MEAKFDSVMAERDLHPAEEKVGSQHGSRLAVDTSFPTGVGEIVQHQHAGRSCRHVECHPIISVGADHHF